MTQVQVTYKDIWRISYPIMLGSLAQTILGLTDTAFLGHVGEIELGASAIAGVYYFVLTMLGMAIGIGAQILIARKTGEGNTSEIGKIYDHTFLLLLVLSIILFIALQTGSGFVFHSLLRSEKLINAAIEFITYRSWGIIFVMIAISFRSFFIGIAVTRVITYSAFLMTGINILLAYAMIFGHWGLPAMGIGGAGLASSISECLAAIYLLTYMYYKKEFKTYLLFKFKKIEWSAFANIMNLSAPVMLQYLISMGAWFLFFVFIEKLGEHPLAISNIVRSTYMVMMTPVWGFGAAANTMTSNIIGQGRSDEVLSLLKKISLLSLAVTSVMVLINVLFPKMILSITTSDVKLINDSIGCFYVICGAMIIFCISSVIFSGVSGTGNTRIAMLMEIGNIFLYMLYVYICVLVIKTTVEWVWGAEFLYWLMMGLFSFIYLRSNHWKKLKLV